MVINRPPITIEAAKETIALILNDSPELAERLLELVLGIADPKGDQIRYSVALEVARDIMPHTAAFDKFFEDYLTGKITVDEDEGRPPN